MRELSLLKIERNNSTSARWGEPRKTEFGSQAVPIIITQVVVLITPLNGMGRWLELVRCHPMGRDRVLTKEIGESHERRK